MDNDITVVTSDYQTGKFMVWTTCSKNNLGFESHRKRMVKGERRWFKDPPRGDESVSKPEMKVFISLLSGVWLRTAQFHPFLLSNFNLTRDSSREWLFEFDWLLKSIFTKSIWQKSKMFPIQSFSFKIGIKNFES